ncbi:NAD(P)/FAD-dependent oxidoreductase [Kiloniella laminariae]|uniref:NAD(P)/FAD-dependent oxidoreductase n=1 Tax=Kiloniella laminariae TaxID=454162 RepID=UPI00035EF3CD|nr:NAD(P)/FAD-dependent oxidoreductase [Kiloniella laminariae]
MSEKNHQTDVTIIGAGPTGLFAVFQCGMLGMKTHVVDALEATGGQCTALYPEKPIYDIPGFPSVAAAELIEQLEQQAAPFDPVYHLDQQVTALESTAAQGWKVTTSKGHSITSKAVILAAGAGAFGPNRPPLAGLESYEGKSVFYLVKRREDFRDKSVVIAGGGDSAVDWAMSLPQVAKKVYVVHRRDKFRAAPESVARMRALADSGKVEMIVPYQLHGLSGKDGQLDAVIVKDMEDNERILDADVLLPFYGLATDLGPIANWGFTLERGHILVDPTTCETRQQGIFAIGDIATYKNKLKLILCGFSEAAMAAHAIHSLVFPEQELHFQYSTSKGVPGEP